MLSWWTALAEATEGFWSFAYDGMWETPSWKPTKRGEEYEMFSESLSPLRRRASFSVPSNVVVCLIRLTI